MQGGEIIVTMESTKDTQLFERMVSKKMLLVDGSLEVWDAEQYTRSRTLKWEQAYIYSYAESMNARSAEPMTFTIGISPLRLDFSPSIRIDRRVPQTYGFWWEEFKPEEKLPIYVAPQPEEEIEYVKNYTTNIKVPKPYQDQFTKDINNVFSNKIESLSFDDDEFLVLKEGVKDFKRGLSSVQRKVFAGLHKVMKDRSVTTIIYENHYNLNINGLLKKWILCKSTGEVYTQKQIK